MHTLYKCYNLTMNYCPNCGHELSKYSDKTDSANLDELYITALDIVRTSNIASTAHLQRRLQIGYSKAARLIERMEDEGKIGPADGAKPREILIVK